MEITHDVTIDLLRPRQNVIRVVQEDSTRTIRLKLLSNNQNYNVANDLDEGETLLKFVEFRKADGHGGMYDTTSTGETAVELEDSNVPNVWLVNLDGQCFTAPGWTQINVRFETESGMRIHTFAIMVDVEPTASSDTESTDWNDLSSIAGLRNAVTALFETRVSMEAKQALLNLLAHVAYVDEHGQDYYDELETELFRTAGIVSISAVFDQGSAVVYDYDDLDTLRQYLTVTAIYEDMSQRVVTGYTLSGTLEDGTSTITVSYGGKTATFDVTVTGPIFDYKASRDGLLSEQSGITKYVSSESDFSETLSQAGNLRLEGTRAADSAYLDFALSSIATCHKAKIKIRAMIYRLPTVTSTTGLLGLRVRLSNGSSGAIFGQAKSGTTANINYAEGSTAKTAVSGVEVGDIWREFELYLDDSAPVQKLTMDGEVVFESSNLSTYYTTNNAIFIIANPLVIIDTIKVYVYE